MITRLLQREQLEAVGRNRHGFDEVVRRRDGARMILIPAGPCVIGTPPDEAREVEARVPWYPATVSESPVARPVVREFLIDRNEVTGGMFAGFLNAVRARPLRRDGTMCAVDDTEQVLCVDAFEFVTRRGLAGSDHAVGVTLRGEAWVATDGAEQCPVTLVTWFGAVAYARFVGCELPTEIEWEKAARGPEGRRFPWGDAYDPRRANTADRWLGRQILDQRSWDEDFHQNGHGAAWLASRPLPVGTESGGESYFGCEDMIGNVAEWCTDVWAESQWAGEGVAKPPDVSPYRSMRGAGRYGYEAIARCACRRRRDPHSVSENLGFRCVLRWEDSR